LTSGFFCRQFSIAVWPLAWSPKLSAMQTTSAALPSSLLLASGAQAEALEEAVVALRAHRVAGEQVERGDLGRLAGQRRLGVLADQHAGLVVVGGEQRVGGVGGSVGLSSAITSTPLSRAFLIAGTMALLSLGVIRIVLAPAAIMFSIASPGRRCRRRPCRRRTAAWRPWPWPPRRAFLHLHEERVGLGLGDQADHRLTLRGGASSAKREGAGGCDCGCKGFEHGLSHGWARRQLWTALGFVAGFWGATINNSSGLINGKPQA
jgi:hypothetical protein